MGCGSAADHVTQLARCTHDAAEEAGRKTRFLLIFSPLSLCMIIGKSCDFSPHIATLVLVSCYCSLDMRGGSWCEHLLVFPWCVSWSGVSASFVGERFVVVYKMYGP